MTEQMDGQVNLFAPDTWSGKMSPERSAPTKAKTSPQSSKKRSGSSSRKPPMCLCLKKDGQPQEWSWETDGALLGVYSMHSFGESPNAAAESHLSQILEDNPHPKYYLSAKACQGILNRAERRGKDLPQELKLALMEQATPSELGGGCDGGGKGALVQTEVSGTLGCNNDQTIFYAIGSYNSNAWKSENPNSGVYETDIAKTLDAINCGYPGCNQGGTAVVCLNDQGGNIMSVSDGVSATPRAQEHGHQPCILDISHRGDVVRECGETVPSPCAKAGTGGNNVPCVTYQQVTGSLMANSHPGGVTGQDAQNDMLAVTAGQYGEYKQGCGTLRAAGGDLGGGSENLVVKKRVRRLTPFECERLQGYPDGWTDIGTWVDSKGKRRETSDAARYKALGNSIALPPWKWVLKRLCAQYERNATMGSLFDGIGGFGYLWEQLNGKGSCLFASEIEEFPMAVTKLRFSPTVEKG